jgi:carboxymethylenebutenolidase
LVGETTPLTPKHPIDIVAELKVPVLGLYGGSDDGIPVETVEQMRSSIKYGNTISEIILYPDTPHAFFADYRPSYRKKQAEGGWKRLQDWFKKNGVA